MAIHRLKKDKHYVILDNRMLRNPDLSAKAKMVLAICLSLPDDWVFNIYGLTHFCSEGQDAVRAAIGELEEKGYVVRTRKRVNGQYKQMDYDIFECPELNPAWRKPGQENPVQGNPPQVSPPQEKPQIPSTYQLMINQHSNNLTNPQSTNLDGSVEERIRRQIEYDLLKEQFDARLLDDLVAVMADTYASQAGVIPVNRHNSYPAAYVKSCLDKINPLHVEQILKSMEMQQPTLCNTKRYLLASLINTANTMQMGYQYGDY